MNPLTGILEGFRATVLGLGFDWEAGGIAVVLSLLVFLGGVYVFRRTEKSFADVI
jgi:lipopolysaccharide transport system permease protein